VAQRCFDAQSATIGYHGIGKALWVLCSELCGIPPFCLETDRMLSLHRWAV